MKIAITGGAGFIGSHLTKAYLDAGHEVIVIDTLVNSSRSAIDSRARFYNLDIRDSKLRNLFQAERPDIVSHHVAGAGQSAFSHSVYSVMEADMQTRGLVNVLEACVAASVSKFIFASAGNSLYGCIDTSGHLASIVKEDAALCPQMPYDISKVSGEWYVRYYTSRYGLSHTIFRYADVYGETDALHGSHPLSYFTHMLLEERQPIIQGEAESIRDHIFIDDVVRANLYVLERGLNRTLHISSGQGHDVRRFYYAVAHYLGSTISPIYITDDYARPTSIILDNSCARAILGWQPEVNFATGIRRSIERLRTNWKEQTVRTQAVRAVTLPVEAPAEPALASALR